MRLYHLVALIPVVALCATIWLPFVNTSTLWFGIPPMFVWSLFWVLAITPCLRIVEWLRRRAGGAQDGGEPR